MAAPYPASDFITGLTFEPGTLVRLAAGSDNWASTWGADGKLYATWGDGDGFEGPDGGMGVATIDGTPPASLTGDDLWRVDRGSLGGKSLGIVMIDGVLYMLAGPGSNFDGLTRTWLQYASAPYTSWTYTADFFTTPDGFSKPCILQFGQDYAGARDTYVYVYGVNAAAGDGTKWTEIFLARVPKTELATRASWEFLSALDGSYNPSWSSDVGDAISVFTDASGGVADSPSVMYHPGFSRYLLTKTFDPVKVYPSGGLSMFEAPEPWGPWRTIHYEENWQSSENMYFFELPRKWISGLDFWGVFTGWDSGEPIALDAYQHMKGSFTVSVAVNLNTQARRQAVKGVGRPWLRGAFPDASKGILWRSSVGNSIYLEQEVASSHAIPVESTGRIASSANVPDEAGRDLIQGLTPAYESLAVVAQASVAPYEARGMSVAAMILPHELRGLVESGATIPYALQAMLTSPSSSVPYEGIRDVSLSGVVWQEQLSALALSSLSPSESLASMLRSGSAAVESLVHQGVSSVAAFEWIAGVVRAATVLHEVWSDSLIIRALTVPHEFRWNPVSNLLCGQEWVAPVSVERQISDECGKLVQIDVDVISELQASLSLGRVSALEWLQQAIVSRSIFSEGLVYAWAGRAMDKESLTRILQSVSPLWEMNPGEQTPVSRLIAIPHEYQGGIVGVRLVPYEARQTEGLDAIDIEWTGAVMVAAVVPYEARQGFVPRFEYGAIESEVFFPIDREFSLYI